MARLSSSAPPGLIYIVQDVLPKLGLPLLSVLLANKVSPYTLPTFVWVLVYVLVVPFTVFFRIILLRIREDMEIKRLGARRVPQVPTRWPAGIDALIKFVKSLEEGYIAETWDESSRQLGSTFNLRLFWEDMIITTEPNNIKSILSTDFDNFEKGWKFRWYVDSVLGMGVFNSDGDMWKFHRGMTRPFFARDRVTDFELFGRHADTVLMLLKERFAQGEAVDFQDIMSRFTLDSATEFLFGSCVNSLSARLPDAHNSSRRVSISQPHPSDAFAAAFNQAQHQISIRSRLAELWPLHELWKDKTQDSMKVINDYINPILLDALARKSAENKNASAVRSGENEGTLLDQLIEHTDDVGILRDEIINIMIAGRDTTMATLTYLIYCLSQHPEVLARLREEILQQVGPNRRPTFEDVKECKYLRAVINETLRLYPPVPMNVRRCKRSTVWAAPDGGKPYYIPAGVQVPYVVLLMHRRKDLWGPDADEFDPDRFIDERLNKYLIPNPFIFLPFNAGPRICLGQQFAYNEISFMVVRLMQAFDTITLAPDAQPQDSFPPESWKSAPGRERKEKIWSKAHLTMYAHKGVWLTMQEASYTDTI